MSGTQSIERAVALLRAVARVNHTGGLVAEIAADAGLERTTAHRMLTSLADQGLLTRVGEPRRFVLGPLAYQLGKVAAERIDLRKLCAPALDRIAAACGDTVFLMARDGFESVCLDRRSGDYPVKTLVVDVGTRRPLGVGAGSMAILAALPPEEAAEALRANASRFSGYVDFDFMPVLEAARREGRSCLDVIGVPGVRAIAVPVRSSAGSPTAALSISATHLRMTSERQAELFGLLEREARRLSDQLSADTTVS